jgi:outer membrane protein OmpA-like peptidoglycan-associated protein
MRRLAFALVLALAAQAVFAERFAYDYRVGDKFRVLSEVDEKVYVNRRLSHSATIYNRIAFSVVSVNDSGEAFLRGTFQTTTKVDSGESYVVEESYDSEYWLSRLGVFRIEPRFFMPVVRNVPSFPDRDIAPGDTWTAPGEERHDFRVDFGIPDPYVIPFVAAYEYLGPREWRGQSYPAFKVSYVIFYRPPVPARWKGSYPVQIAGHSDLIVYWDKAIGHPVGYEEAFRFVFDLANGMTYEYSGSARSRVVEAEPMDRQDVLSDVEDALEGVEGVDVRNDEKGVTISMSDIKFKPESAVLEKSELSKLDAIVEILKKYPDRDILITGHTALAGTEAGRAALSLARAQAVADYLISKGIDPERIMVQGLGATQPIADNTTQEGMAQNRRVEITILEN